MYMCQSRNVSKSMFYINLVSLFVILLNLVPILCKINQFCCRRWNQI